MKERLFADGEGALIGEHACFHETAVNAFLLKRVTKCQIRPSANCMVVG
jgi:hypothetical protein